MKIATCSSFINIKRYLIHNMIYETERYKTMKIQKIQKNTKRVLNKKIINKNYKFLMEKIYIFLYIWIKLNQLNNNKENSKLKTSKLFKLWYFVYLHRWMSRYTKCLKFFSVDKRHKYNLETDNYSFHIITNRDEHIFNWVKLISI